ncbi:unnamed protein product [Tuber melanosporum]|uniref:(Perigord truffle) hypothetical protein n=1 Tax=Tuber melanosporum (strain Mel28) TaxID=656061 RepID=D5GKR7_TUBMM|nr:uncharacterized protein GSTUM_00009731001 [Tuber melanosporum]CAZ85110.1 unnamed protein product [Tuber melanosporum]
MRRLGFCLFFMIGMNVALPTGEGVMVKKGEAVWFFFERAWRMSGPRESLWISVDDLVFTARPMHFEFCYFIVNHTLGPNGLLFHFPSSPTPTPQTRTPNPNRDNPTVTNMVDRRWYENKHIFPASVWTEFDPHRGYWNMVRRDMGGNTFSG